MIRNQLGKVTAAIVLSLSVVVGACNKEAQPGDAVGTPKAADAVPAVPLTGRIITVEAYSDGEGNYFKPKEIEANRGDVVRFVLKSGVHNIHFLPDSNPSATGLPAPSEMLQLPDQTYDVTISFADGRYFFQCDPHAALGMVGYIKVGG